LPPNCDRDNPSVRGDAGYEETYKLVAERGFAVDEAQPYSGEHFGSWLIVVSTTPRLRIIWDGKDAWVSIQTELVGRPRPPGYSEWEDLWIGKRPEDTTPSECVKALERLRDFATEARRY
jgi:hypothetical protein